MRQVAVTQSTKPMKRASAARAAAVSPVMNGGMPRALGIRIVSLTRKKVVGEMPIKPMHVNNSGSVNGGAIMAFADVLGAAGAVANRPPGHRGGTIESKTNFFAAGTGPVLSAVSIPLHIGRTTTVWQTTISNPDGRVVAIVTQTQIMLPHEPERTPGARKKHASRGK
jgi:1,4-dihydroxy-2-naphthoyl-CoA hydrolase